MITLKTAQSKPRPNCLRRLILTLTVICALAEPISCSAMREMRQNDLNEQSFTALEHGSAAELAALLDEGADPNYVPHSQHEENVLSALLSSLRQGRIALNVRHGLPMLGYALNGFSNEDSRTKAHLKQLKAKHLLPPLLRCTDPLGKMRVLLEHHADPNRSYIDSNPLFHAVGQNRPDAVQLLLLYGANPDVPTASGDTARKAAVRNKYGSIVALLPAK